MKKEIECPACKQRFKVKIYGGLTAFYCPFCREKVAV